MKRFLAMIMILSLLLGGCGWFQGSYVSVTPHQNNRPERQEEAVSVSNYDSLCRALEDMVREGRGVDVIHVPDYVRALLEMDMGRVMDYIRDVYPFGAYAVEDIHCELGTSGAIPAIAVEIVYRNTGGELKNIRSVQDMEAVQSRVGQALERYDSGLVLLVSAYTDVDLQQIAEDYADDHPDTVMETPRVTQETYPKSGDTRILEIRFSYQNSRDDLRQMQEQTAPVFASAALYVSAADTEQTQYGQLYAFLKERFSEYQIKTSITPAYSLLRHGVGDSEAFAMVYARMCRRAGLDCSVVTGTRDGEAWSWNMVCCNGNYYHVDLLNPEDSGRFRLETDARMENYVWDYSAYPACDVEFAADTGEDPELQSTDPVTGTEAPAPSEPAVTEATTAPEETTAPASGEQTEPETKNM